MPLIEYLCKECGERLEVLQKISDEDIEICKKCGGKLKRLISLSSFHLKGGGWSKDGYRKETK